MWTEYQIYNEDKVRNTVSVVYEYQYFMFNRGGCKCILQLIPDWSAFPDKMHGGINFFALTDGWQDYAPKGYKMNVFSYVDVSQLTPEFIENLFCKILDDAGFVAPAVQESLF